MSNPNEEIVSAILALTVAVERIADVAEKRQKQIDDLQAAAGKVEELRKSQSSLNTPIEEAIEASGYRFSVRAIHALVNDGIKTIGDLMTRGDHDLMRIPNFGNKSLNEVHEFIRAWQRATGYLPPTRYSTDVAYMLARNARNMTDYRVGPDAPRDSGRVAPPDEIA